MRSQMAVSSEIRDGAKILFQLFDRRERCRDGARALLDDGSIVLFEAGIIRAVLRSREYHISARLLSAIPRTEP
jgi:hypothetical protein